MQVQAADRYYKEQQKITAATALTAKKLWERVGDDFNASWSAVAPLMLDAVQLGRAAAVTTSLGYTADVLAETGQVAPAFGELNPQAFLSQAPNGQPMADVLAGAVVQAKVAVKAGSTSTQALDHAGKWLTGVLLTTMADTGRAVVGADIAQRPTLTGYTRMLNAPSCSRCVILAGKWFRWNEGFLRHPRCDCRHIPASEDRAGDLSTDPYAYFNSLSEEKQNKLFRPHGVGKEKADEIGRSNARAIRDGGDIYRIENVRLNGLSTARGKARYGSPDRMTVDDIYRTAGTRTNALKMLEREGYVTGPQVRGGNIIGNGPAAQGFGQLGKGGKARAASNAVLDANASGVRDPLNRYTMTAAERRLYDSQYRLNEARRTGNWPRSIGENSADKYSRPTPLAPGDLETLERAFQNEAAKVEFASPSVQRLAGLLGIK